MWGYQFDELCGLQWIAVSRAVCRWKDSSTTYLHISTYSTHLLSWILTYLQISTCSMHLFRYVLPSVPHTGSLSFPHRCSQCDPDDLMQSPGSDASRTPAKVQTPTEDVTIKYIKRETWAVANQLTESSVSKVAKMRNKLQITRLVCFIALSFLCKVVNK
jgi:hypothetical protein